MELPIKVITTLDMFNVYGDCQIGDRVSSLADLNDRGDWTFVQIADFVEARPELFFN
jgi:hypothetical protein